MELSERVKKGDIVEANIINFSIAKVRGKVVLVKGAFVRIMATEIVGKFEDMWKPAGVVGATHDTRKTDVTKIC